MKTEKSQSGKIHIPCKGPVLEPKNSTTNKTERRLGGTNEGHNNINRSGSTVQQKDRQIGQKARKWTSRNNNFLSCLYTNADSLPNKLDELKTRITHSETNIQIVGVTEVYPKNSRFLPSKGELQMQGFY